MTVFVLTLLIDVLVAGVSRKTLVAITGSLMGTMMKYIASQLLNTLVGSFGLVAAAPLSAFAAAWIYTPRGKKRE